MSEVSEEVRELADKETSKPRYREKRACINWRRNQLLQLTVGLAHHFFVRGVTGAEPLRSLVAEHLPEATSRTFGRRYTWDDLVADTAAEQGPEKVVTAHRLLQRADKARRYDEHQWGRNAAAEYFEAMN